MTAATEAKISASTATDVKPKPLNSTVVKSEDKKAHIGTNITTTSYYSPITQSAIAQLERTYCSAVDDILCREGDNKTIGLLLCRTKDKIKAEYALRDINKPIGVSDYELGNMLPKDFRSSLPSIEDIERDLSEQKENSIE